MAKGLKIEYAKVDQKDAEYFWERLSKKNISEAELENISEEIKNSQEDYVTAIHDTAGVLFKNDKKIYDDYCNKKGNLFNLSADAVQRIVDTVDVYKESNVCIYSKNYNLPKVTEKNKDAILMHFVSNITAGEVSKGYLDNTCSLKRFASENTREPEFIIPNVPGIAEAKKKIENAKTAVKPKISLGTRFLGYWQKKLGMDKPARRAYEDYHQKLNEYNALKDTKKEAALISKFESVTSKHESLITKEFANVKAEKARQEEAYKQDKERAEKFEANTENWEKWRMEVKRSIYSLKNSAMKDYFPNYARGILKDMKDIIKDMPNKDKAQEQYDALEKEFKDALKAQDKIKGKVTRIDDKKLSQKMGVESKNHQTNKSHFVKPDALERVPSNY